MNKLRAVASETVICAIRSAGAVSCCIAKRFSSTLLNSFNSITSASIVVPGSGFSTMRRAIRLFLKSR